MGKRLVTTLNDLGANIMRIDRRHITKSTYTGKYIRFRTFTGHIERFPQCRLHITSPYYTGITEVASLRNSVTNR